jgi:hypothetical protein
MAKDYTKYEVKGMEAVFTKGKLVLAIVSDYCSKNECTFEELKQVFPDKIQGSSGIFDTLENAKKIAKKRARHFVNNAIKIKDGSIAVSNQWGGNISDFIAVAEKLGYDVSSKVKEEETVAEAPAPGIDNKVNINISGRIPNYMFGILGDEEYAECEKAMSYAIDDDIETMAEFVEMYYQAMLYGGDGMEIFKESIDMEQFKSNCPLLSEFLDRIEEGDAGHLQFYEEMLNMSWEEVNIIEDDAYITITVDGEDVVPQQKLADFLGEIEQYVDEEDDPKAVAMVKAFWAKNGAKFNMEDREEYTVNKAKNGVLQFNEWFEPDRLKDYKTRERNITVEHDNIVDFDFFFETVDFDLSKLAFLQYGNATDFHRSSCEYVGSFLSYDNNIIHPDQNIHRDKGFTLFYEVGLKSCDFLIEG